MFAPGGRFVFTYTPNIAPETPSKNILAVFEVFKRF